MDVSAETFEAEVIERSEREPVVVDFWPTGASRARG